MLVEIKMCLWSVQYCGECYRFTSVPSIAPQHCSNPECLRLPLDPNNLTLTERNQFLDDDYPCLASCNSHQCGLVIRYRYCGDVDAVNQECDVSEDDSEC